MATPEDIKLRISATNDTKTAFNQVNTDLARTSVNASKTQKAVLGTSSGFSNMGRSAGQAGIQVQQLVGQIQGGTNPMLALSQQAADLGFVLGAPLLGAVAGLAASFAMVLIPALFNTKESIADIRDMMEGLNEDITDLTAAQLGARNRLIDSEIKEYEEKIKQLYEDLGNLGKANIGGYEGVLYPPEQSEIEDITAVIDTYKQKIDELEASKRTLGGTNEEQSKTLTRLIEGMQEEADTLGMTATQLAVYRAKKEGATAAQLEAIIAIRSSIDLYNQEIETSRQLAEEQKKIADARAKYAEEHRKQQVLMAKAQEDATRAMEQNLRPVEDALVNLISGTKSVKEAFKDMARAVISDLIRMQVQQAITAPLAGMLAGFNPLGGAPTATAMPAPSYMPPSFAGGGYTGSGARSGGIDGMGGFPAVLHPNETIVDHTKGGASGVTINQTINVTTGVQQTVRTEIASLMPQIAAASKQAVLDARKRGGSFSAAFGA